MTTTIIIAIKMTCMGFKPRVAIKITKRRKGGGHYKLFLLFLVFDTCFVLFLFVDCLSDCVFPFEPKMF